MSSTRVTRHFNAPRARVFRALVDRDAVQQWMVHRGSEARILGGLTVHARAQLYMA